MRSRDDPRRGARGRRCRRIILFAAVAAMSGVPAVSGALPGTSAGVAKADDMMGSRNPLRDGWDPNEPALGPAVVASASFGRLFSTPVNGQVWAQPLVAGNTLVVATANDWVYGLSTRTGAVKWSTSLGKPWTSARCKSIAPDVGVTGTPVYDPVTGSVYMVARVVPAGDSGLHPVTELAGVNVATGHITETVPITGAPVNDPARPFDSYRQLQRPALLLMNGWVYAAFGSFCDAPPYSGYVAGVNVTTRAVTLWTDEAGVSGGSAGIWQSGGGIMSDGPGRLFVTSGNGVSPPRGPGASPPPHLGDSVIRLTVRRDGSLQAGDFFSPADAARLEKNDLDLGSSLPLGLPFGTHRYPHLIMQASKDGRVFLLNRDDLGGRAQGPDGTDKVVSAGPLIRGKFKIPVVFGIPAVFGGTPIVTRADAGHDYVYFVSGRMHALHFEISGSGVPTLVDQARSTTVFGYSSGSPLVTSNGAHPGSAVVWDVYSSDGAGDNGRLEAFDAMPQTRCSPAVRGACLKMIWSAPIGFAVKFAPPATDGGRVFIGSRDGHVLGFGIVHPARHQAASR